MIMGYIQRLTDYLKSARLEVKNVNWPTRRETVQFTILVIAVSALVAAYLGALDLLFIRVIEWLIL
ncbi:MAG: preprotein translocase subunit SecE [Candidatus Niyogibacteria bacterium]|nr:preprotein translocase subunit SecE [Candidatus Niyogibacteria bacterium]